MAVTAARLNRATLARQLLLRRERTSALDALRRVFTLQAQDAASPYLALWNRVEGFDGTDLDEAFADGTVLKASTLRLTLHAHVAEDQRLAHAAMVPYLRAARLHDRRFTSEGLTTEAADALLPDLLALLAEPRSKAEVEALCGHPRMWWALRTYAPLVHAPTGGPWSFGTRPAYVAAPGGFGVADEEEVRRGRAFVVRRYLEGFGPATEDDVATATMLRKPVLRDAVADLGDEAVRLEGPGGRELLDVRGGSIPEATAKAPPRLLGMWDEVLLAYADRSRILPEPYRALVIRRNGDVLPTVLVDGLVAGVWRVVDGAIEVTAFRDLAAAAWRGIAEEAEALATFLAARDAGIYRRHHNWWADLPATQVRTLAPVG